MAAPGSTSPISPPRRTTASCSTPTRCPPAPPTASIASVPRRLGKMVSALRSLRIISALLSPLVALLFIPSAFCHWLPKLRVSTFGLLSVFGPRISAFWFGLLAGGLRLTDPTGFCHDRRRVFD